MRWKIRFQRRGNEKRLEEVEGSVVEVGTDSGLTENV